MIELNNLNVLTKIVERQQTLSIIKADRGIEQELALLLL
jgi:hypothetical protein